MPKTKAQKHRELLARHAERKQAGQIEDKTLTRSSIDWKNSTTSRVQAERQRTRIAKPKSPDKKHFFFTEGDKPKHGKGVNLTILHNIGYDLTPTQGRRVNKKPK